MKRKDFLKSCFVLGIIPFMPRILKTKEKPLSGVYETGFHQKKGVVQGFWHEDNGELEVLILDYQRIPYDKKLLGTKLPDSLRKKYGRKEYFAHNKLFRKFDNIMNKYQLPETWEEAMAQQKIWKVRLKKWTTWLSKRR